MSDERPKPLRSPLFDAPIAPHVQERKAAPAVDTGPSIDQAADTGQHRGERAVLPQLPKRSEVARFEEPPRNTEELLAGVSPDCEIDLSDMPTPEVRPVVRERPPIRTRPVFWFAAFSTLCFAGWSVLRADVSSTVGEVVDVVPPVQAPLADEQAIDAEGVDASKSSLSSVLEPDGVAPAGTPVETAAVPSTKKVDRSTPPDPPTPEKEVVQAEPPKDGGFLTVVSDQRALVIIDGASLGYTPVEAHPLRRGVHRVRLVVPGGPSAEKEVTVQTDQETIAEFSLYP